MYAEDEVDSIVESAFSTNETQEEQGYTEESKAKILHLEILSDINELKNQTLYIGQYISITYRLMLLNDAKIVYTEFNPSLEDSKNSQNLNVALAKEGQWVANGDYYTATFSFKILDSNFSIPSLVVHVQNNFLQDSMQTDSINLSAQSLVGNAQYCGVVASGLKVVEVNVEENDESTNMLTLQIEATNSNLEDFTLPHIKDQEFSQGSKFGMDLARINLVARVPKDTKKIEFSYFDINKHDFIPISVNVDAAPTFDDDVKEDLNPKSSFFRISNLTAIFFLAVFLLLTIFKRSYIFAGLSVILAGFLIYKIFSNTYSIRTLPNAKVLILPTKNSTELLSIPNPTKLEAIDKKNGFYKVNIDSKVGWISKDDTNKK